VIFNVKIMTYVVSDDTTRQKAQKKAAALEKRKDEKYVPWPKSLTDYLKNELLSEFEFKYFVLDRAQFDDTHKPKAG
jgi:hypothetical protein